MLKEKSANISLSLPNVYSEYYLHPLFSSYHPRRKYKNSIALGFFINFFFSFSSLLLLLRLLYHQKSSQPSTTVSLFDVRWWCGCRFHQKKDNTSSLQYLNLSFPTNIYICLDVCTNRYSWYDATHNTSSLVRFSIHTLRVYDVCDMVFRSISQLNYYLIFGFIQFGIGSDYLIDIILVGRLRVPFIFHFTFHAYDIIDCYNILHFSLSINNVHKFLMF